jgi:hypothetical protein
MSEFAAIILMMRSMEYTFYDVISSIYLARANQDGFFSINIIPL